MKRSLQIKHKPFAKKIKNDEICSLPIYNYKDQILRDIKACDNYIIISTTGSGKTTQIPKFLYNDDVNKGKMIGISQPRRIATISIATRVSEEMNCEVGETVGYSVRFEYRSTKRTKIKFMTDGLMLREAVIDPLLKSYNILILDEVHERTVNNDLLFGVVLNAQKLRKQKNTAPLKCVIMSATMDPKPFLNFFGENTKYNVIDSVAHPLTMKSLVQQSDDYVRNSVIVCFQLHMGKIQAEISKDFVSNTNWSILIFLTGEDEIRRCCDILIEESKKLVRDKHKGLSVYPLYSALPSELQRLAVTESKDNLTRNVIVSTNIAETSITIPGVRVVIDCGFSKQKFVHPVSGLESLQIRPISQAQAEQRAGRASRLGPGICFRLYTDHHFESVMPKETLSELYRANLATASLTIFNLGFHDVLKFPWLEKPDVNQVKRSINILKDLAAIDETDLAGEYQITELGKTLLRFPLDPRFAFALLESSKFQNSCLVDVTAVVAMLTVFEKLFHTENSDRDSVNVSREFYSPFGDLVSMLRIYRAFTKLNSVDEKQHWCRKHCIKYAEMNRAVLVNKQLKEICKSLDLPMKTCREETVSVVKCFVKPFRTQIARSIEEKRKQKFSHSFSSYSMVYSNLAVGNARMCLHPSSVLCLNKVAPEIVLYMECVETKKIHMRYASMISPEWLD